MGFLSRLSNKESPNAETLATLLKKVDFNIDADYLSFIKEHDGAAGFLSADNYVLFWKVADVVALNPYFKHDPDSNNYLFFGSDGSSLGYAFDKINNGIVAIDFYEFGIKKPDCIANSFKLFIDKLAV